MLIAVLSQKGVVCKSTTTVQLADLDLQQTSIVWLAAADGFSIPCRAIPSDSDSVLVQLPPLLEGGAVLVVDGPAGLCGATRAVMLADVVLTTVQPAGADLRSAVEVLQLISQARRFRGGGPMPSCTCTAPQRELCC